MKKTIAWLLLAAFALAAAVGSALAVTYTEDGGMVVGGDGNDDFSDVIQGDPDATYTTIILPGDQTEYDEYGNPIEPGPGPTFAPGELLECWLEDEGGNRMPVTLLNAGTHFCQVRIGRDLHRVPTASLCYGIDGSVTADKRIAYINAKKTGYATMHTRASVKSDVVNRCTTNQIVLVLAVGKKYCKVWCAGDVGYIKRSSLAYYNDTAKDIVQAVMTYKGRTSRSVGINIRQNGKANSRILDEIPCGTPLEVFAVTEDGWTEVEVKGWRCWVQSKYITYENETDRFLAEAMPITPEETEDIDDTEEAEEEDDGSDEAWDEWEDGTGTAEAGTDEAPEAAGDTAGTTINFYDAGEGFRDGDPDAPSGP
ncbi:MAG: hypothetical protein IJK28_08320 [Clostridia bacterium]|nr:hypothetical protein [Clostridia bacterium]